MSERVVIEVEPLCLELGSTQIEGNGWEFKLRRFQEKVIEFFNSDQTHLFLSAYTGSGKTFTLFSPLISNILNGTKYDGALGIYPTKPLTVDQFESLKSTLERLGGIAKKIDSALAIYEIKHLIVRRDGVEKRWSGKVGLVALTRDEIDKLRQGGESRKGVLSDIRTYLLREDVNYLVALAVPEYPYLMISGMYRNYHDLGRILDLVAEGGLVLRVASRMSSLISEGNSDRLKKLVWNIYRDLSPLVDERISERGLAELASALLPPALFFDEFHTWSFSELPTVIALVALHRLASLLSADKARRAMYKLVFSSATPSSVIRDYLSKVLNAGLIENIEASVAVCGSANASKIRGRTEVELYPVRGAREGKISWLLLDDALRGVVEEKSDEIRSQRAIVLGRHPRSVEEAAVAFYKRTGYVPAVVTGVHPPQGFYGREELVRRRDSGHLYVFGNYAVELGVDLQNVTYSIVCAASLGELVQRVGRSGRGGVDSKVVILVPENYIGDLKELGSRTSVTYSEFLKVMGRVMPDETLVKELGDRAILGSNIGKARLYLPLATYVLLLVLRHRDKPGDLRDVLIEFANIVKSVGIGREFFLWLRERVFKNFSVLAEIASFRLSPTVPYVREGSQNRVDGEANPVTLLANYEVRVDESSGFKLVIRGPARSSIRQVASVEMCKVDVYKLRSLHGTVLPANLLKELIGEAKRRNDLLLQILEKTGAPVYVVTSSKENSCRPTGDTESSALDESSYLMMVLNAYGRAVRIHCAGDATYAYLLLL